MCKKWLMLNRIAWNRKWRTIIKIWQWSFTPYQKRNFWGASPNGKLIGISELNAKEIIWRKLMFRSLFITVFGNTVLVLDTFWTHPRWDYCWRCITKTNKHMPNIWIKGKKSRENFKNFTTDNMFVCTYWKFYLFLLTSMNCSNQPSNLFCFSISFFVITPSPLYPEQL